MNKKDFFSKILPRLIHFRTYRIFRLGKIDPITLTFSVTAACQSRCKTCNIGHLWLEDPTRSEKDLTLEEIEKIFATMNPVYFFNISGGEPFLRKDLSEIVNLACKYLKPRIIHTPTNALLPQRIAEDTRKILEIIRKYDPTVPFTVKPSIDGIGHIHDEIRGVEGNFNNLIKTVELLKEIEQEYDNFHLELGTVVSNHNIDKLDEIEDFVHSLGVESYRNEVAEQRSEFFNIGDPITPTAEQYTMLMKNFSRKIAANIHNKRSLARTTEALRLVYYEIAGRILEEKRQVIPCYAGISNVHLNYDGGVWPCCVLGYEKEFGNLRDYGYNFQKLWYSAKAAEVRRFIREGKCACPLANQAYSNILLNFNSLRKVKKYINKFR
jgi:MoaA/NifB/PqqE/SkfB family radical SAM enzyme